MTHLNAAVKDQIITNARDAGVSVIIREGTEATASWFGRTNCNCPGKSVLLVNPRIVPSLIPNKRDHSVHLAIQTPQGWTYAMCHDQGIGNGSSKVDKCQVYMSQLPAGKKRLVVTGLLSPLIGKVLDGGVLVVSPEQFVLELIDDMFFG